jgi:hypothetical protein
MSESTLRSAYRGTAVSIFVHIVALFAGFTILAAVFEFPDVLRETAAYRLDLYRQGQTVIQPVYWVLAMTGFTQIAIAGFLYRSFRRRDDTVVQFAVLFGILCGILQTMGFIRWAILIPWLAQQMAMVEPGSAAAGAIALVEGAFNRYAGMALGEHAANLCLALWTGLTGVALLRTRLTDRRLGWLGVGLGVVAAGLALEQLGIAPVFLGFVVDYGFPLWAVWLVMLGVSLLRTDPEHGAGPRLGWGTAAWAAALYLAMVAPVALA